MGSIRKSLTLILILLMAISSLGLCIVKPLYAQSYAKPSVPEFTLSYVMHPYDVAPTYTINPYTGDNETAQFGYHVENSSIEISIKNQPLPYYYIDNQPVTLYYNVSYKGHFGADWMYYPISNQNYPASKSNYTVEEIYLDGPNSYANQLGEVSAGSQIDIQVEACLGYYTQTGSMYDDLLHGFIYSYNFTGETSGWSPTQTITIPAINASPTPTVPELSWFVIMPLLLSMLSVAVIARHRKQVKKT